MTRATVVHDPVAGDRLEVFLRASDIWTVLDVRLRSQPNPDELGDISDVHACLDPLGMPEGPDGHRCWSVPPEAMWRLVTRCVATEDTDGWLAAAVTRIRRALLREFPELPTAGHVDPARDGDRASAAIHAQLNSEETR